MWFAKWFGRRNQADDDEPARHCAPPAPKNVRPTRARAPEASSDRARGFDPYNSGAFERSNAWERVVRR
jgi:hypothetical protein